MLYLTRKCGQSIVIGSQVEVTVVEVRGRSVKLGVTFPADTSVVRQEVFARIQKENEAAAQQPVLDLLAGAVGDVQIGLADDLPTAASEAFQPSSEGSSDGST